MCKFGKGAIKKGFYVTTKDMEMNLRAMASYKSNKLLYSPKIPVMFSCVPYLLKGNLYRSAVACILQTFTIYRIKAGHCRLISTIIRASPNVIIHYIRLQYN